MGRTIVLQVARPLPVPPSDPVPPAPQQPSLGRPPASETPIPGRAPTDGSSSDAAAVEPGAPRSHPPTPPQSPRRGSSASRAASREQAPSLGLRRSRRVHVPAQHKASVPVPLTASAGADAPPEHSSQPERSSQPPRKGKQESAAHRQAQPPAQAQAQAQTKDPTHEPPSAASILSTIPRPLHELEQAAAISLPPHVSVPSFACVSHDPVADLGKLFEAVQSARRIAVVCGAGISVSPPANIPDFRSSEGLFRSLKQQHPDAGLSSGKDLFDARLFTSAKTTGMFYSMVSELKAMADRAQPTAFHHMLKMLDEQGRLLRVYTQNIDGLEAKAGLTFGLGSVGDTTTAQRALGKKRKRAHPLASAGGDSTSSDDPAGATQRDPANGQNDSQGLGLSQAARRTFARSQSDSALLWSTESETEERQPMFPRCIPLHGSLHTLTCSLCSCTLDLCAPLVANASSSLPDHSQPLSQEVQAQQSANPAQYEGFPPPGSGTTISSPSDVLRLLRAGEPVPCPKCEVSDEVRTANNLRSRGIGKMNVNVVLYGGQNESAERVGECLGRDILGLRDPGEPPVPESVKESQARRAQAYRAAARANSTLTTTQKRSTTLQNRAQAARLFTSQKHCRVGDRADTRSSSPETAVELDADSEEWAPFPRRRCGWSKTQSESCLNVDPKRRTVLSRLDRKSTASKEGARKDRGPHGSDPLLEGNDVSQVQPKVQGLGTVPETELDLQSSDQVLQSLFAQEGQLSSLEDKDEKEEKEAHTSPSVTTPTSQISAGGPTLDYQHQQQPPLHPQSHAQPHPPKRRAEKLKALPPDLLIVAGTSLKVPGTKRIVREFAKACHAQDARWYPSSYYSAPAPGRGKTQSARGKAHTSDVGTTSRSKSAMRDSAGAGAKSATRSGRPGASTGPISEEDNSSQNQDQTSDGEDGYDSQEEYERLPIRTVLINAEFPHPSKEWAGVFDVWLQGDVQQAALGLAPTHASAQQSVSGLSLPSEDSPEGTMFRLTDPGGRPRSDSPGRAYPVAQPHGQQTGPGQSQNPDQDHNEHIRKGTDEGMDILPQPDPYDRDGRSWIVYHRARHDPQARQACKEDCQTVSASTTEDDVPRLKTEGRARENRNASPSCSSLSVLSSPASAARTKLPWQLDEEGSAPKKQGIKGNMAVKSAKATSSAKQAQAATVGKPTRKVSKGAAEESSQTTLSFLAKTAKNTRGAKTHPASARVGAKAKTRA